MGSALSCAALLAALCSTGCGKTLPARPGAPASAQTPAQARAAFDVAALPSEASAATWTGPLAKLELAALAPVGAGTPARRAFDAGQWRDAADGLAVASAQSGDPAERRALGIMHLVASWHAGDAAYAAKAFDRLAAAGGRLAGTLSLWAAEAWLAAGQVDDAARSLGRVPSKGFARADRRALLQARIATLQGDPGAALAAWKRAVEAESEPLAHLLFEAADAAAAAKSPEQQARWLRMVRVRFPGGDADARAEKALANVGADAAKLPLQARVERLERARALHRRELVLEESAAVRKEAAIGSEAWCAASTVRARVLEIYWKRRKEAVAAYAEAVKHCKGRERSKLLYRAAQREANSGSGRRALAYFAEIERDDPKSTLVDDAMRWRARILREQRQHKAAAALLEKVLTHGGDMVEYAAWDLLWHEVQAGDWRQVESLGARVVAKAPVAEHVYNRGRLRYWWGRAAEHRKARKVAADRYADVVRDQPNGYYGWLAALRLQGLDAKRLAKIDAEQKRRKRRTDAAVSPSLLADPHLPVAVELLRMGMASSARAEIAAVRWPKGEAGAIVRAALDAAVGAHARAIARVGDHEFAPSAPLALIRLAYPQPPEFAEPLRAAAKKYGVDPDFVWAIMRTESRFSPTVQSPVLATGLLQLMLPTAKAMNQRLGIVESIDYAALKQPAINIPLGVGYMARLRKRWDGNDALVASSYNAGPGNTRKWVRARGDWPLDAFVEAIPFRENRRYVKSVLTSWRHYGALAGRPRPPLALALPGAGDGDGDF
ncbi:MAG: lytic transglycosylase domain-containing protein [Deltaproteobacteria bacterium]|nr:lytic transglycosylase domain-containing protein [Deltaproteobacteria bacterium]